MSRVRITVLPRERDEKKRANLFNITKKLCNYKKHVHVFTFSAMRRRASAKKGRTPRNPPFSQFTSYQFFLVR